MNDPITDTHPDELYLQCLHFDDPTDSELSFILSHADNLDYWMLEPLPC